MAAARRFVDLQVNGYGGVDFNADDLTLEQVRAACVRLADDGVAGILATVITAELPAMCRRIAALAEFCRRDPAIADMIVGLHIEGPFLNESAGFRGAHPPGAIRPAEIDAAERLLEAAGGLARIVTLAPERDPNQRVTRWLVERGVVVSAGHTDASLEQLGAAIDAGLSMFTHLGNGCPMMLHRHDNIIQRALSLSGRMWIGLIADGVHVPWPAMINYLRAATLDRCFVVTDAMAAAGLGPGRYRLAHWDVLVGDDRVARSPDGSHFVGSAGTMPLSRAHLIAHAGLSASIADRLLIDHPRRAMGGRGSWIIPT